VPPNLPPHPPAIVAPAPPVPRPKKLVVQATPVAAPASDVALRAALVQQAGALKAAQETANATRAAAETAARNAWWAALLALVGAVFGALVAWRNGWLQTRTTQQIKHADFRQAWIDKLREEMARFTRLAAENDGTPEKDAALKESLSVIVLRMDKDDPDYNDLMTLMGKVADESAKKNNAAATNGAVADFLFASQAILKREWEVTKHDMHVTPWGRPFSWIAARGRRRRREEEKEIVRRGRKKLALTPVKELGKPLRWPIRWRTRQKPPRDPKEPIFRLGRLELMTREPKPTAQDTSTK
jgi:hypothetical protein